MLPHSSLPIFIMVVYTCPALIKAIKHPDVFHLTGLRQASFHSAFVTEANAIGNASFYGSYSNNIGWLIGLSILTYFGDP